MFSVNRMCYDPGHVHSLVQQDLGKYLSKGTFPLMSTQTVALWKRLVTSLEKDCKATVKAMKLLRGYEDSYSPKISFGTKDFETGFGPEKIFVCYAHQRLCKGFALAEKDPWQKLIQRLRAVIVSENFLDASDVHLLMSPYTNMGGGLNPSPVSLIPDASLGVTFGSVPDQNVIAGKADCWRQVKKRCYESAGGQASFPADYWQPPLAWLGKKPHYVLAHLLNHNLNGPGGNELNVVPFWATANTQMSNKIEKFVKDLVSFGVVVTYSITAGDPMKLDPTYATWAKTASGTADQKILKGEQELPQYLTFNATAKDSLGNTVNVVPPGTRIDNFVPLTVPTIY
jgi:hypothetical protein